MKNTCLLKTIAAVMMITVGGNIYAQLKGTHLLGDFGLDAGTQQAPSIGVAIPFYIYDAMSFT